MTVYAAPDCPTAWAAARGRAVPSSMGIYEGRIWQEAARAGPDVEFGRW